MSKKYKFTDNGKLYFVSFGVTNCPPDWVIQAGIDLFIKMNRNILLESVKHCQKEKDLELYGCCLMTRHFHLILGWSGNALSNIMRNLKRRTSEELHKTITNNKTEIRKEWVVWIMQPSCKICKPYQAQKVTIT